MLNVVHHPSVENAPGLLIVHGLYGSARNWGVIAKRLSDRGPVMAVDQRNHGSSDWRDTQSYHDMAEDLSEVISGLGNGPVDLLGHSMGGKAAMVLALTRPELVNRLIVADIAPVAYAHSQIQYIEAMRTVDLHEVTKRSDAEAQLAQVVDDPTLISFFTQSLDLKKKKWRLNLDVLAEEMTKILGFPQIDGQFDGKTLFVSGAASDYVTQNDRPRIKALFPNASFMKIKDAGHWLHAEKPREFESAVRGWLDKTAQA
ncbi:MAG: alpha/beta fold hydrolase [Pseudomonadota bacterium]